MGNVIQGETKEYLISSLPEDLTNVKLFVYVSNFNNTIAKFSLLEEEGFSLFESVTEGITFMLDSETTAKKSSGVLQGELQLFYTDGRIKKSQFTFINATITESVSPSEAS